MARLILYLLAGVVAIAGTGLLVSQLQALLEGMGHPLPKPLFLGLLAGSVVFAAKWAMDACARQLALLKQPRATKNGIDT